MVAVEVIPVVMIDNYDGGGDGCKGNAVVTNVVLKMMKVVATAVAGDGG
jgi:hypothetical protein